MKLGHNEIGRRGDNGSVIEVKINEQVPGCNSFFAVKLWRNIKNLGTFKYPE